MQINLYVYRQINVFIIQLSLENIYMQIYIYMQIDL